MLRAQSVLVSPNGREDNYNNLEAFDGNFYVRQGDQYRSASGAPGVAYWQNQANYKLSARLVESESRIIGTEELTYINNSPDELRFLWMQLDQNLFKGNSRGAGTIPAAGSRSGTKGQVFNAGFHISNIYTFDSIGRKIALEHLISDTRMQVFLPYVLKGRGDSVRIGIDYSYIIPNYGSDRTGILETKQGKVFAVAQWYPRMCVYDDVSGWNTTPYLGLSEFYLEYGNFEVSITVPAEHIVMCSGELLNANEVYTAEQNRRWTQARQSDQTVMIRRKAEVASKGSRPQGDAELTWRFSMQNSRDIAWASSEGFIVDAARIELPGGGSSLAISAYTAESEDSNGWSRSTEFVKGSVEHYSRWLTPYPYPAAVSVATDLAGMEYPGLVFCNYKDFSGMLWGVTDHEFGHTWFPMIVGSNERLHGWMDEGLNTFINYSSSAAFKGGEFKEERVDMHKWGRIFADNSLEPVMTYHDNVREANIAMVLYLKPALGLRLLQEQILGPDRFNRAFKAYVERWKFKHPQPEDFFRTIENVAGEDLNWFWRGWFRNNWKMDQAVENVVMVEKEGMYELTISIKNLEKLPMPVIVQVTDKKGQKHRRSFPVDVWRRNKVWTFKMSVEEEPRSIELDPDHVLPDCNPNNDIWEQKRNGS